MNARRRLVRASALLLLAVLAACGQTSVPELADPPRAASSPTSNPEPEPVEFDTTWDDQVAPKIGKTALRRLGAHQARQGVDFALDIVQDYAFNEDFLTARRPQHRADLLAVSDRMMGEAATDWNAAARTVLSPTTTTKQRSAAHRSIGPITIYAPYDRRTRDQGKPVRINDDGGPTVINPRILSVHTDGYPDHFGQRVRVKSAAGLRLLHDGRPATLTVFRDTTLWVYRDNHEHKIYGWRGTYKGGKRYRPER